MNAHRRSLELLVLGGSLWVLTGGILSLVLHPGEAPTEGNASWRLILAVCYLGVVLILLPYYREALYILRRNWFLLALVLFALISCSWTTMPALILRRSVAVLGVTLVGVALAIRLTLEDQLRLVSWLFRILAVLSLACIVFLPQYGISWIEGQGAWQGVFNHKNELGDFMALSIMVECHLPADTRFSKVTKLLALLLSAVLLLFSASLTPVLALGGSLLFTRIYRFATQRLRVPLYILVVLALIATTSGVMELIANTEGVTEALGRSSDFTGRTVLWSSLIPYILERPIQGYGYSAFWAAGASGQSASIERVMGVGVMYSHNGYLEILLSLGAIGFFLALVFLGTGVQRAVYRSKLGHSPIYVWPLALMVYFLIFNLGEATILIHSLQWALCVATILGTDPVLFASEAEEEYELPLVLAEASK
jgi:exopolysaccharide production protein ExoQ